MTSNCQKVTKKGLLAKKGNEHPNAAMEKKIKTFRDNFSAISNSLETQLLRLEGLKSDHAEIKIIHEKLLTDYKDLKFSQGNLTGEYILFKMKTVSLDNNMSENEETSQYL